MINLTLIVMAGCFAVVTGMNDGGSLLSAGLRVSGFVPLGALALLAAAVAAAPMLLGTAVATTLAVRLVSFSAGSGRIALAAGVLAAIAVVVTLTWRGLPTSLTLALVGGLTGAGLGSGLPVHGRSVLLALLAAALAPVAGVTGAYAVTWLARLVPARPGMPRLLRQAHRLAFCAECAAYAANDGQKMLAVAAIATGVARAGPPQAIVPRPWLLAALAVLFSAGIVLGLHRVAACLTNGVTVAQPADSVAAELAAATAVFGSTLAGMPVSTTQAMTGGLVGAGLTRGARQVRWSVAADMGLAWAATLPVSIALGAAAAAVMLS